MTTRCSWPAALWPLPLLLSGGLQVEPAPVAAQAPSVITMDQEPHHHLVLHNNLVNVFDAKATPGDSLLLLRHDHDAVAIAIGVQVVTVGAPGKPDVQSKNADGQVRMQRSGYVHSTRVDGDAAYFTVAVELLRTQTGARNLCASVLAGQPLNCPDASADALSAKSTSQPQFESDQTRIEVVRIRPHQNVNVGHMPYVQLIVALDPASISPASGKGPGQALRPGDFVWFDKSGSVRTFENKSDKEARFIKLIFQPSPLVNNAQPRL